MSVNYDRPGECIPGKDCSPSQEYTHPHDGNLLTLLLLKIIFKPFETGTA